MLKNDVNDEDVHRQKVIFIFMGVFGRKDWIKTGQNVKRIFSGVGSL